MHASNLMQLCIPLSVGLGSLSCAADLGGDQTDLEGHAAAFSTAPFEPNHENITRAALGFLKPEVLDFVVLMNVTTDQEFVFDNASHFDDCNFQGGSALVASRQAEAVQALAPQTAAPVGDTQAIVAFSRSLHALQDFYAHSNWVELGGAVLLDSSLTPFPLLTPYQTLPSSSFVVVQGAPSETTSLARDDAAPYPGNALVHVHVQGPGSTEALGLISGTVDYEAGDDCPAQASLTHDALNKDRSDVPERSALHESAMALATQQTRHEWCRLNQLTLDTWGQAGTQRLAAWVSDPLTLPDCNVE